MRHHGGGHHHHHAHGHIGVGTVGQSSPLVRLNLAKDMIKRANDVMDRIEGIEPPPTTSDNSSSSGSTSTTTTSSPSGGTQRSASTNTTPTSSAAGGFSTGPIQFQLGGFPAEATATIHVQSDTGDIPPGLGLPAGLESIQALMSQALLGGGGVSGNFSFRMENGQLVPNNPPARSGAQTTSSQTTSTGAASSGGHTSSTGASAGGGSGGSTPGSPGSGIRHPPPTLLAEVMDQYNSAQTRLTGLGERMSTLLRSDAALDNDVDTEEVQQYFDRYSSCLHFLSHAQHAMSDIMLNFSRPPPRQLRARPFMIQSVVQSAVIQSVPVITTSAERPTTTAGDNTSTTTSSSTTTSDTAAADHEAAHAAAHAEAVRQAVMRQAAGVADLGTAEISVSTAGGRSVSPAEIARMIGGTHGAVPAGARGTAHMQPVMVRNN